MATLDQRVHEVRLEVHGFSDFDRCMITKGTHSKLHMLASGPVDWPRTAFYGARCVWRDKKGIDNTYDLEQLARSLRGMHYEQAVERLLPIMELNPNLELVRPRMIELGVITDNEQIRLAVLSKNDVDLIRRGLIKLGPQLQDRYGITVVDVFGNVYEKDENDRYTGKVTVHVAGNKKDYYDGMVFVCDEQDSWRNPNYEKLIKI